MLKCSFLSLKRNKSASYDDISVNVVKKCFGVLRKPLLHIFNLSLQTGMFLDKFKIARVTPLFKGGKNYELGNCRPISVLPCFLENLIKLCVIAFTSILLTITYFTKSSLVFRKVIPLNMQYFN